MRTKTVDLLPADDARRLWFFESLDRIHRALRRKLEDRDGALVEALDVTLDVLACDRAWLVQPNSRGDAVRVVTQRTRSAWPNAVTHDDLAATRELRELHRLALEHDAPVTFGAGGAHPLPASTRRSGARVAAVMAIDTRVDGAYVFGLHRCESDAPFSSDELRLVQELGRRIGDALGTALAMRNVREREYQLERAARIAKLGHWERDLIHGTVMYAPETARILGQDVCATDVASWQRAFFERIHPDDRERVAARIESAIRLGRGYESEYRIVADDGTVKFLHSRTEVVVDSTGHATRMFGTLQDITERVEIEQRMIASEQLYRTVVDHANDALLVHDDTGRVIDVNRQACESLGYSRRELLAMSPADFDTDATPEWLARLGARIHSGKPVAFDSHHRRKDGTTFPVEVHIQGFTLDGRKLAVSLARDMTDRKNLQEQLLHAQKMEAVGRLAGGVAHDFNNLLGAILMEAEFAEEITDLHEEARTSLTQIREAAQRATALTRQLLLFARRQVLRPRSLDLNAIVCDFSKMLQRLIGEDVRLDLRLSPDALVMVADGGMLEQVLMNLVVNARDAMPGGGTVTVSTAEHIVDSSTTCRVAEARAGRYARLMITDTGHGIPPEIVSQIFEPFFTTKAAGHGTGLGLATVFGIVKEHRGWITVDSAPGATTFTVFLPLDAEAVVRSDSPEPRPQGGTETIFLVEDEAQLRRGTRRILERHGYRVIEAESGAQALLMWPNVRDSVSVLLTDIVMPGGVSGFELASRLTEDRQDLAVILASGYSSGDALARGSYPNLDRVLTKPLPTAQLLDAIRGALD